MMNNPNRGNFGGTGSASRTGNAGHGGQGGDRNRDRDQNLPTMDVADIMIWPSLSVNLLDGIANSKAEAVSNAGRGDRNKSSQLRKFYDELVAWQEKIGHDQKAFEEHLPFVLMLKAKVAYAQGRDKVTPDFTKLLGRLLDQVREANHPKALLHAKLFFEAFLGFYRTYNRN